MIVHISGELFIYNDGKPRWFPSDSDTYKGSLDISQFVIDEVEQYDRELTKAVDHLSSQHQ